MAKKVAGFLFSFFLVCTMFTPRAFADTVNPYELSVSSTSVKVGDTVHFTLRTPSEAASVGLYINGKKQLTLSTPLSTDGGRQWAFDLAVQSSGTKDIRFYVYSDTGKLMKRYPDAPIAIKATWPLYAPVSADVAYLEYDMAVLSAKVAPGYTYKRYGFYLGTSEMDLKTQIRAGAIRSDSFDKLITSLMPGTTYYFRPFAVTAKGVALLGDIKSFTTSTKQAFTNADGQLGTLLEKYNYLFSSDARYYTKQNPPMGYRNAAEAKAHMVTISVKVWVKSGSNRKTATWKLTVNRKLAESIKAIFEDIYALPIKFPIMQLKCFSYRTVRGPGLYSSDILSHHSYGAAIDINKPYNLFYRSKDKRNPNNPYTIPKEVIAVFEKHGWFWGGNFKEGLDTMHFQYLGLDLLP